MPPCCTCYPKKTSNVASCHLLAACRFMSDHCVVICMLETTLIRTHPLLPQSPQISTAQLALFAMPWPSLAPHPGKCPATPPCHIYCSRFIPTTGTATNSRPPHHPHPGRCPPRRRYHRHPSRHQSRLVPASIPHHVFLTLPLSTKSCKHTWSRIKVTEAAACLGYGCQGPSRRDY